MVREETAGGCAALAVSRVVGGAGEARLAREEAEDGHDLHDLFDLMNDGACVSAPGVSGVHLRKVSLLRSIRNSRTPLALTVAVTLLHHLFILLKSFSNRPIRPVAVPVRVRESMAYSSHSISWGTCKGNVGRCNCDTEYCFR